VILVALRLLVSQKSNPAFQTKQMTTKPTDNDVLSGRGAWFNQHPGNGHFRRMLDEQKVRDPKLCPRRAIVMLYIVPPAYLVRDHSNA
jgi:hypothetical protein